MQTNHIIKTYPVLTIYDHSFSDTKAIQRINLKSTSPRDLVDLSFFSERPTASFYASQDSLDVLQRNESGSIKYGSCIKVSHSQLRAIREALVDRHHRHVSEVSLSNLKTAKAFTPEDRPTKPRKYSDELVTKARDLRKDGLTWSQIAKRLEANLNGIKTACR